MYACGYGYLCHICLKSYVINQKKKKWDFFSPVCVRRCFFRKPVIENPFLKTSQTWGFSPVSVWRWFFKWPALHKYEDFHLYKSGDGTLSCLLVKILCYIRYRYKAFYMYVPGYANSGHIFVKILSCKIHKHEAFYMYVCRDGTLSRLLMKILFFKFTN